MPILFISKDGLDPLKEINNLSDIEEVAMGAGQEQQAIESLRNASKNGLND